MTAQTITETQLAALRKLGLPEVKEKNQWLVLHVKGDGIRAPESWNAKVYTNSTGSMKVVTTDIATLAALLDGRQQAPQTVPAETGRVISIDDSGFGFPLLGTLVGIHDSKSGKTAFCEVPVDYFQSPKFEAKAYLDAASIITMAKLTAEFNIPDLCEPDVLFKVCTGYVNKRIVETLRENGFNVETCTIGEPLQSALEKAHAKYVRKHVGSTLLYYDPKELTDGNIRKAYSETMAWIAKYDAWGIAKTGWKSMKKYRKEVIQ